jgi:hypothetical protein
MHDADPQRARRIRAATPCRARAGALPDVGQIRIAVEALEPNQIRLFASRPAPATSHSMRSSCTSMPREQRDIARAPARAILRQPHTRSRRDRRASSGRPSSPGHVEQPSSVLKNVFRCSSSSFTASHFARARSIAPTARAGRRCGSRRACSTGCASPSGRPRASPACASRRSCTRSSRHTYTAVSGLCTTSSPSPSFSQTTGTRPSPDDVRACRRVAPLERLLVAAVRARHVVVPLVESLPLLLDAALALVARRRDLHRLLAMAIGDLSRIGEAERIAFGAGRRRPAIQLVGEHDANRVRREARRRVRAHDEQRAAGKRLLQIVLPESRERGSFTFPRSRAQSRTIGAMRDFENASAIGLTFGWMTRIEHGSWSM